MNPEKLSTEEIISTYKSDVEILAKYIPWFESKSGRTVSHMYEENGIKGHSITVPVYDGMLLQFVKEARNTKLMDRNYAYVYTRNHIRSVEDEWRVIHASKITDFDTLRGLLSYYVLKGFTKSSVWSLGVENEVFVRVIAKMKELIEFWDGPLA